MVLALRVSTITNAGSTLSLDQKRGALDSDKLNPEGLPVYIPPCLFDEA
jgi:hypothetical protein